MPEEIRFRSDVTVELVDSMGSDDSIVQAMLVSTKGADAKEAEATPGRINFLMANRHGTPFEHAAMTFYAEVPIFVFREWHRHRIGVCLAGDTEISVGTLRNGVTKRIDTIYRDWYEGVPDVRGRTRLLPSCRHLAARTVNFDTGLIEFARMVDAVQAGVKPLIEIETSAGRKIKATREHQFVAHGNSWVKAGDLVVGDEVGVQGKVPVGEYRGIPRRLRMGIQEWTTRIKAEVVAVVDTCHVCGAVFDYGDLEVDHVVPVVADLSLALCKENLAPICSSCHGQKSARESWRESCRRPVVLGLRGEKVIAVREAREEMTYDISMPPPWHNFVANGFVVHNSYNEMSGRYSQLPPTYYIPGHERNLVQTGKPGAYSFEPGDHETYEWLVKDMKEEATQNYARYQARLDAGVAKEVARMSLGINIFSAQFFTCNPRSMMAFLSLRTKREGSMFPSYPMREIEMASEAMEWHFAERFPLTYRAFQDNGRVAP